MRGKFCGGLRGESHDGISSVTTRQGSTGIQATASSPEGSVQVRLWAADDGRIQMELYMERGPVGWGNAGNFKPAHRVFATSLESILNGDAVLSLKVVRDM